MPKRIVVGAIHLRRDPNSPDPLVPEIGTLFDFTDEELADIKKLCPDSVRLPVNEDATAPVEDPMEALANAKIAKRGGGNAQDSQDSGEL